MLAQIDRFRFALRTCDQVVADVERQLLEHSLLEAYVRNLGSDGSHLKGVRDRLEAKLAAALQERVFARHRFLFSLRHFGPVEAAGFRIQG